MQSILIYFFKISLFFITTLVKICFFFQTMLIFKKNPLAQVVLSSMFHSEKNNIKILFVHIFIQNMVKNNIKISKGTHYIYIYIYKKQENSVV